MNKFIKLAIFTVSISLIFISTNVTAKSTTFTPIKPQIVGGEVAAENDWPWMSALVYTFNEVSTSLTVDGSRYDSESFSFGVAGSATGETVDCGIGEAQCIEATNKICLIERGDVNFSVKVDNCQAGGGLGAIIYNNEAGIISGTLGDDFTGTIPVVAITQADGIILKNMIGTTASLSVAEGTSLAQDSTCGASFLGGKWLLTAAHCVDGVTTTQLKVNVGEYDLSNGAENAQAVKRIYMHSEYQLAINLDNDIALIELFDEVNNEAVTLIDLAETQLLAIENSSATVTGWGGRVGYDAGGGPTSSFPDVLHQVDLQLMTNETCANTLALSIYNDINFANNIGITDSMICAGVAGGGKGSCQGDSGGPLMVNTNEGWQQIGIVSWGIGCAADGYPGVYTRSAVFIEWINQVTKGIAIEQTYDFGLQPQNTPATAQLTLVNNSSLIANLTFAVEGDASFTLTGEPCNTIAIGESCELSVNYDAAQVGKHSASIVILSNNVDIPTSRSRVTAETLGVADEIKTQLSSSDPALNWFSGGDSVWQLDNSEAAITSGAIVNKQESSVMVTFSGEGELAFEWSVSSEKNADNPADPFDALYLTIDGELIKFISGEIAYTLETFSLPAGEHQVTWVYRKDPATSAGDDKGYLRNVVFTPVVVTPPAPPPTPSTPTPQASSSSGGSIAWLSLLLLSVINIRRK